MADRWHFAGLKASTVAQLILRLSPQLSRLDQFLRTLVRGQEQSIRDAASATTLLSTDWALNCDVTSAGFTVTLPPAADVLGRVYVVQKVDASGNTLTLDADGSETIDGATTWTTTTQWDKVTVQSDGTAWFSR